MDEPPVIIESVPRPTNPTVTRAYRHDQSDPSQTSVFNAIHDLAHWKSANPTFRLVQPRFSPRPQQTWSASVSVVTDGCNHQSKVFAASTPTPTVDQ